MTKTKSIPAVDIIVPVFNPKAYFEAAMEGILGQDYSNFQVILINDCSTAGLEIIDRYRGVEGVVVLDLSINTGGGGARNAGLCHSTGDYIAFCDSDDVWPSGKLSKQVEFMESTGATVSHTDIVRVAANVEKRVTTPDEIDVREFLRGTSIFCSTVCVRGEIGRQHRFGEMRKRHPFKYWVELLQCGHVSMRVPDTEVRYLHRAGSVSSGRISTISYTVVAFLLYPKNKWIAICCLFERLARGLQGEGRSSILKDITR